MPISSTVTRKARAAVAHKGTQLERLVIEYVPIDSIAPNDYNPNRQSEHDFELLLRSMEDNGFTQPVMVRRDTSRIVDGYHRWLAAQHLGMAEIPVVFVDHDDIQARIATLGMNRARGSEEVELTAALLRDLQALGGLGAVQDSLLLDDTEIALLIDAVPAPEALAGDDFTAAWEPSRMSTDHVGEGSQTSVTDAGASTLRKQEEAVAQARTEEEKKLARADNAVYRLSLIFNGDEAETVKAVLGDRPAVMVLELCQTRLATTA